MSEVNESRMNHAVKNENGLNGNGMKEKAASGRKNWVKIIDVIYGIGVLIVIYHLGLLIFAGSVVPYPDAMLPSPYWEIVPFRLAMGAIPMTLASIFFWRGNELAQSEKRKRNFILTFLPTTICLLCFVFYAAITIYSMVSFGFGRLSGRYL